MIVIVHSMGQGTGRQKQRKIIHNHKLNMGEVHQKTELDMKQIYKGSQGSVMHINYVIDNYDTKIMKHKGLNIQTIKAKKWKQVKIIMKQ